jgi:hypothetical protein
MNRLIVIALCFVFASAAQAQDVRFGARVGLDVTSAIALQVRADFGGNADGFGVRAVVGTNVIFGAAEVAGYYRLGSDGRGSGFYLGAGGGLFLANNFIVGFVTDGAGPAIIVTPYLCALIGYQYAISDRSSLFIEARPALSFTGSGGAPVLFPLFGVGINIGF